MRATLTNRLRLHDVPWSLGRAIAAALTVDNPEYVAAYTAGRYAGHLSPTIAYVCWPDYPSGRDCEMPPGALGYVAKLVREHGEDLEITDLRRTLPEVELNFQGELRPYQADALRRVTHHSCGILGAPTGSGKTVMALRAIAQRRQPALVMVHTQKLARQWIDRAERFLGLSRDEIGLIGAGGWDIGERLTIALPNSLAEVAADVSKSIGHLVVDECHRCAAKKYSKTIGKFDARYRLGLSATPYRRDTLSRVVHWLMGPVTRVDRGALVDAGAVLRASVHFVDTGWTPTVDASDVYQRAVTELSESVPRRRLIAGKVAETLAASPDSIALVLANRRAYCADLQTELRRRGVESVVLTGEVTEAAQDEALGHVDGVRVRCIIGTVQLVGEGWDWPRVSDLHLASPVKWKGVLVQAIGRVLRPAPGKDHARIYDYRDGGGVFRWQATARERVYKREKGVTIGA